MNAILEINGQTIYIGVCLLDILGFEERDQGEISLFEYKTQRNKRKIFTLGEQGQLLPIFHSPNCPARSIRLQYGIIQSVPSKLKIYIHSIFQSNKSRVLLTRRFDPLLYSHQYWGFPGGKLDTNETPQQFASSKLKHECNITIQPEKFEILYLYESLDSDSHRNSLPHQQILKIFLLASTSSTPSLGLANREICDMGVWLSKSDFSRLSSSSDFHISGFKNKRSNFLIWSEQLKGVAPNSIGEGIGEADLIGLQLLFDGEPYKKMEQRVDSARNFLLLVRHKFQDHGTVYEEFLRIMKAFKEQRWEIDRIDTPTVCKKVQELFDSNRHLLEEFNKLIPSQYKINVRSRLEYLEAMDYMKKVKEETKNNPEIYEHFVSILKSYSNKHIALEEVEREVTELLVHYPSLIESFKLFIPKESESEEEEETPPDARTEKMRKVSQPVDKSVIPELADPLGKNEMNFFRRLKHVLELNSPLGSDYYLELCLAFELYVECVITKLELFSIVEPLFVVTSPVNFIEKGSNVRRIEREDSQVNEYIRNKVSEMFEMLKSIASTRESSRRKFGWFFRGLAEFDTSKCKKHGNSYMEIQRPRIKQRKDIHVINRQWVSVPHGSEDVSFRYFRKNAFEDALFKCEDERFEHDMTIEKTEYMLDLLEKANANVEREGEGVLDENLLSPSRLKTIHNIYGEHAENVISILLKDPKLALPVLIFRLNQKVIAWKQTGKSENERGWLEIVDKNFTKSLDHRSFYFKQNEKKLTNSKSFLIEAKERFMNRHLFKAKLLDSSQHDSNFEYIGGSVNKFFFNSFSGLSATGVTHRIPASFEDTLEAEVRKNENLNQNSPYLHSLEEASLPEFRLLMNSPEILIDSIRLLLFAIEKTNVQDKFKLIKWVISFFQDFMRIQLPFDVLHNKIEEFFGDNIQKEEENFESEKEEDPEQTLKIITKWFDSGSITDPEPDSQSLSDLAQDPINLKKDTSFSSFLPLMEEHQVFYCPGSVYSFFRIFYCIYERVLKLKLILSGQHEENQPLEIGEYEFKEETKGIYNEFLWEVCMVIKNANDSEKFEEKCRNLLKNDSYVFFTFDKLASQAAKILQSVVQDDLANKSMNLFNKYYRNRLNEEMYVSEYLAFQSSFPFFRLHWNTEFNILSISYIESLFEKINDQVIKNAQKYYKELPQTTHKGLQNELTVLLNRVGEVFDMNGISIEDVEIGEIKRQNLFVGLSEGGYKLSFPAKGEESMINMMYFSKHVLLTTSEGKFLCRDRNSFVQKIVEESEERFTELKKLS